MQIEFRGYSTFLHNGGHPAFDMQMTVPSGMGFTGTMVDGTDEITISFGGDPVITSQEFPLVTGDPLGLSFNTSGATIKDITGLGALMTTAMVPEPASIQFPTTPTVTFLRDAVQILRAFDNARRGPRLAGGLPQRHREAPSRVSCLASLG